MKKAIFLVPTIAGIRKATFLSEVNLLIQQKFEIVVLLAMTNFDDVWQARRLFSHLVPNGKQSVRLLSLAEIYSDYQGVDLQSDDFLDMDFDGLEKHDNHSTKNHKITFIDQYARPVAETLFDADDRPIHTILMSKEGEIKQVNNYDQNGDLFGIEKYEGSFLSESLLLNKSEKLVFRFINYKQPLRVTYTVGNSASIEIPEGLNLEDDDNSKSNDNLVKTYQGSNRSIRTSVIEYQHYTRFNNVYSFYHHVISDLNTKGARLYLDMQYTVGALKHLPREIIFNY